MLIGGIEGLSLIGSRLTLGGPFWEMIDWLNDDFGSLGLAVIGIFVLCWLSSVIIYRWKGYDRLELTRSR